MILDCEILEDQSHDNQGPGVSLSFTGRRLAVSNLRSCLHAPHVRREAPLPEKHWYKRHLQGSTLPQSHAGRVEQPERTIQARYRGQAHPACDHFPALTDPQNKNKPLIEERASSIPHLCLLRDEYATAYRDRRSLSTLSKSARAVEVFLQSIGKVDISLDQIGRRLVTDFIEEQQKRDVAGQTLQNWLTSLGSLYEFAKRRYDAIAPLNPFHGMNLEARRTIESYQPFEWHQLSTLLNEADEELRAVILIGLFSGARLDEIASLKKSDVVIVEGIQTFFISKSKTKAGVRHIPIHAFLIGMVDYYLSLNTGDYLLPQANKIERKDGKRGRSIPRHSPAYGVA